MARVNHKKVKQMLEETRKKITDRQFFTSRILAGHYEDMAAAQTRRYKYNRRIKMRIIWKPRDQSIAVTNNLKILINAGHPIVTKRNRLRQERYMIVTGCLRTNWDTLYLRIFWQVRPIRTSLLPISGIPHRLLSKAVRMCAGKNRFGNIQRGIKAVWRLYSIWRIIFGISSKTDILRAEC